MLLLRHAASGVGQSPLELFAPNNIFSRIITGATLAEDQTPARKIGNQLAYGRSNYSYNGEAAPKFYGYEGIGYGEEGRLTKANITSYSPAIFVVGPTAPTQKVTYVNRVTKEPEPEEASSKLQSYFNAVPVPDVTKVPSGALVAEGTDKHLLVWRPSTHEIWEMWQFEGEPSKYTMHFGGYRAEVNKWNGIYTSPLWGARATSLALTGGLITMQDLVEVLQGGKIKHAIAVALEVTAATGPAAPATRHDEHANVQKEWEGKSNPAYGSVDGVSESAWFRFPSASHPSEYGITLPLEEAIYEAIREYGLFVADGGSVQFYVECPVSMGSPYAFAKTNPLAGAPSAWGSFSYIPSGMTNPSLGRFEEELKGSSSVFSKQPWQTLEQLAPRSS